MRHLVKEGFARITQIDGGIDLYKSYVRIIGQKTIVRAYNTVGDTVT